MDLNNIAKQKRTLIIDEIPGEELTVIYKPLVITQRFREEHPDLDSYLADVLVDWDLYDGDEKIALTVEAIDEQVPEVVQMLIFRAIEVDLNPKAWQTT
jgi:hypothetical protein